MTSGPGLSFSDVLLELSHPVLPTIVLCQELVFTRESVVVMALVCIGPLVLSAFVELLKDMVFHVLPEFQGLRAVHSLGGDTVPQFLESS